MTPSNAGHPGRRVSREANPVGPLVKVLFIQVSAIIAVTVVLTAVYAVTRGGADTDTTATSVVRSSSPAASPSPAQSTSAPATSSAPTTSPPLHADLPKVDVLNQSAPGGSANRMAKQLRDAGWRIGRVDDFRGNISATTVYYPPGQKQAAETLARDLRALSPRVLPGFRTLSDRHLTLLLTS